MKLIKTKNRKELSEKALKIILDEVTRKPSLVIGFATGKTPKKLYKKIVKAYRKGKIDFSKVRTFNLDEFYPIKENSCKSYKRYMFKRLFNKINVLHKNIYILDGTSKTPEKECEEYEKKIRKNKIDLQILGIGENGHIGFNEPGSSRNSKTRIVELTHRKGSALTMGISTILKSKKIILLASGKKKSEAIRAMLKGKIGEEVPASFLRNHKNITVIIDEKAGSLL